MFNLTTRKYEKANFSGDALGLSYTIQIFKSTDINPGTFVIIVQPVSAIFWESGWQNDDWSKRLPDYLYGF